MPGKKRAITAYVQFLLNHFPCVAILGARQVGKSTLLKQLLPDAPFYDLEDFQTSEKINEDPAFFLSQHTQSLVFDEAQLCPTLFSALRVQIDKNRTQNGQFLLSGSSSPTLIQQISESLAGRIALIELSPFLWNESATNRTHHKPFSNARRSFQPNDLRYDGVQQNERVFRL